MSNFVEEQKFRRLESQWSRYIDVMAARFSMEPNDQWDLYNEGLLILHQTSQEFDTQSVDFSKMFRTKLAHHFTSYVYYNKAMKRNVNLKTSLSVSEDYDNSNDSINPEVVRSWREKFNHTYEGEDYVRKFLSLLSDDDRRLLIEMMDPSSNLLKLWDDCIKEYEYERVPENIPWYVYAKFFGWTIRKVRYSINRMRQLFIAFSGNIKLKQFISL